MPPGCKFAAHNPDGAGNQFELSAGLSCWMKMFSDPSCAQFNLIGCAAKAGAAKVHFNEQYLLTMHYPVQECGCWRQHARFELIFRLPVRASQLWSRLVLG
jgi:hypothetical protein